MKLNQLRYFLSVAQTGTITRSAEALNVTQPAITRGIKQLEEELGIPLFERRPRSMQLTRFGVSYRRHVQAIFSRLENAEEELRHLAENRVDDIVIGAGPTWLMGSLPAIVTEVAGQFPQVGIRVMGSYDRQLLASLRRGEVQFVLSEISDNDEYNDLIQEPLIHCRYVVACRRDHPLTREKAVPLTRLLEYPWAMPDQAIKAHNRLRGLFLTENLQPPKPLLQSTSLSYILRLLETSDALSFVAESSLPNSREGRITSVLLDQDMPVRHAGLIKRKDDWDSPVATAFMETLRTHCAKNPIQ